MDLVIEEMTVQQALQLHGVPRIIHDESTTKLQAFQAVQSAISILIERKLDVSRYQAWVGRSDGDIIVSLEDRLRLIGPLCWEGGVPELAVFLDPATFAVRRQERANAKYCRPRP